MAVGIESKTIH